MIIKLGEIILTIKDAPFEEDAFEYLPTNFFKGQLIIKQFDIGILATNKRNKEGFKWQESLR